MQLAGVDPGKVCKDFWKVVEPLEQVFSNKKQVSISNRFRHVDASY